MNPMKNIRIYDGNFELCDIKYLTFCYFKFRVWMGKHRVNFFLTLLPTLPLKTQLELSIYCHLVVEPCTCR